MRQFPDGARRKWRHEELLLALSLTLAAAGCTHSRDSAPGALHFTMDPAPVTLNPRLTIDATGQRLNAILFRGLTRLDSDLIARPDLALKCEALDHNHRWRFQMDPSARDHAGEPITTARMAACLENYRTGHPISALRGAFPGWEKTESAGDTVTLSFKQAQPYADRDLSALRYFRVEGQSEPCVDPGTTGRVIGSGLYQLEPWNSAPEDAVTLTPRVPGRAPLEIAFIGDDTTRALKILRGETDFALNALTLTKTRWLVNEYPDRFRILERRGVPVGYLAFNLKDPILAKVEVRQAIARAIDRESIIRYKMFGFGSIAGSFLSPELPESHPILIGFDPAESERLLDRAGYPRGKDGVRFELRFKTSSYREGYETAQMIQQMLGKVGIRVNLDLVEPGVFLTSIRKGKFQLYASRWIGVGDGSILYNTLHTGQPQNRVGYSSPEMDRILEQAREEMDQARRKALLATVQERMMNELPYFPLWYWHSALIMKKGVTGLEARDLSLSGGIEPLTRLKKNSGS